MWRSVALLFIFTSPLAISSISSISAFAHASDWALARAILLILALVTAMTLALARASDWALARVIFLILALATAVTLALALASDWALARAIFLILTLALARAIVPMLAMVQGLQLQLIQKEPL